MPKLKMIHNHMFHEFAVIKSIAEKHLAAFDEAIYNKKPSEESWSAIECFEHLNLIGHGYVKYFPKEINSREKLSVASENVYITRTLPGYFISKMMPNSKVKLHTPSEYQSAEPFLPRSIIVDFLNLQDNFLHLINRVEFEELSQVKMRSPISPLIKFQLGEMFMLHIGHQHRHIKQAEQALKH